MRSDTRRALPAKYKNKMADENRNSDEDRKKNGDFRMPSQRWVMWIVLILLVGAVFLLRNQKEPQGGQIRQFDFKQLGDSNMVAKALIRLNPQSLQKKVLGPHYVPGYVGKHGPHT